MISLDELLEQVWPLAESVTLPTELVPLKEALGRVVVEDICSPINVPQHDNSSMDGYAVRCGDLLSADAFEVSARIPAGANPEPLKEGTVARIFTGAPIPRGCDAIVMQEMAEVLEDGRVRFQATPAANEWIRRAGEDVEVGQSVVKAGQVLSAFQIGLLASIGVAQVPVRRQLKVGLLITGSELQEPGQPLGAGQIYNSNEYVWHALLKDCGVQVKSSGRVKDTLESTIAALKGLSDCDLVLSSGGVSVGEEDHVKPAVQALGELSAHKVTMKPGKPMAIGQLHADDGRKVWFFGLPGNPVSSSVTFLLVVRPFLRILQGQTMLQADWRGKVQEVEMVSDWLRPDTRREEFLRANVSRMKATLFHNQSSGVLTSLDFSTGFVRVPAGHALKQGDKAVYLDFQDLTE